MKILLGSMFVVRLSGTVRKVPALLTLHAFNVRYVPLKPSGVIPHPDSSGFSTGCDPKVRRAPWENSFGRISNDSNRTICSKNVADFKQVLPFRNPESSLLISPDISGFRMTTDGF
jgi:hypothetical protein